MVFMQHKIFQLPVVCPPFNRHDTSNDPMVYQTTLSQTVKSQRLYPREKVRSDT